MSPIRASLLLLTVAMLGGKVSPAAGQQAQLVKADDRRPSGALYRVGRRRLPFVGELRDVALSPDGMHVAALDAQGVRLWAVRSGKEMARIPEEKARQQQLRFAPDSKSLVVARDDCLCLHDVPAGKLRRVFGSGALSIAFALDRTTLVAVHAIEDGSYPIRHWDVASGELLKEWKLASRALADDDARQRWTHPTLAPEGDHVASQEIEPRTKDVRVCIRDAASGKIARRWRLPERALAKLIFNPLGDTLATASARGDVRVWDVRSGKELSRTKLDHAGDVRRSPLVFGPGFTLLRADAGGLTSWDWSTGKTGRDFPGMAGPVTFGVDGQTLAVRGAGTIRLLDPSTGRDRFPEPQSKGHVAFAPDSRTIAWIDAGAIVLADAHTGAELRRWQAGAPQASPLAFTRDGRTLAAAAGGGRIRLWDPRDGRLIRTLAVNGRQGAAIWLVFSRDGRRLASGGPDALQLWDVASGEPAQCWDALDGGAVADGLRLLAVPRDGTVSLIDPATGKTVRAFAGYRKHVETRFTTDLRSVRMSGLTVSLFSPDGRRFLGGAVAGPPCAVHLWDTATGKRRPLVLNGDVVVLNAMSFSPDGRLLALMRSDGRMALVSVETGAVAQHLGAADGPLSAPPVFTPDGRIVVTAVGPLVQFWEVATGGEIAHRGGHDQENVRTLVMAADGRKVASLSDGTMIAWDLAHMVSNGQPPVGTSELDALWTDLGSVDAVRARQAVERLCDAPTQALALLGPRLKAVAAANPDIMARWVANLGSDDFAQRREATEKLAPLGAYAERALRQELAKKPTLEARRRIEQLLTMADHPRTSPDALRAIRSVQVLEALDDAEASRLLATLARGAAGARLTEEAAAALGRRGK